MRSRITSALPSEFEDYYEPFLGSGAVFFSLSVAGSSFLSDTLPNLVQCYEQVRDSPKLVAKIANGWERSKETYYEIRAEPFADDPVRAAARFLYLNKLCFNGLYRENQKGQFNVPFGRSKGGDVADEELLLSVSERLQNRVEISHGDFESKLDRVKPGDLVYLDPPYVAESRTSEFADYNAQIFSWDDQKRLHSTFERLNDLGCHVIMSNTAHPSVLELYRDFSIEFLYRHSSMASKTEFRGSREEIMVLSKSLQGDK